MTSDEIVQEVDAGQVGIFQNVEVLVLAPLLASEARIGAQLSRMLIAFSHTLHRRIPPHGVDLSGVTTLDLPQTFDLRLSRSLDHGL